jgi:3-polyprenyl-4-hydroxybenzoate decarboxylase
MYCYGGKLGIDATHKWESEGAREWPERIEMSQEVRDLVDGRWSEYGLARSEAQNGGISKVLRQTVRR